MTADKRALLNIDEKTVAGFGDEWTRFDQTALSLEARADIWNEYFSIFPAHVLNPGSVGADFGVGSGRWAAMIAPKVGKLLCVDASREALEVARRNLGQFGNCEFIESTIDEMPIAARTLDFGYSLGVLHHIPDTRSAMKACVDTLKPGAPFLVYLYYRFENKPRWYAGLWALSEGARRLVSGSRPTFRYAISQLIALSVYWPLARFARLADRMGLSVDNFPLAYYRFKPLYVMRTDALDRFGTRLEQRFSRPEIEEIMRTSGLRNICFRESAPFWCALGWKEEA